MGLTVRRVHEQVMAFGGVSIIVRSGVDTPSNAPVFDLVACEVLVHNNSDSDVALRFNGAETFVYGFRFTFGAGEQNEFSHPRPRRTKPEDVEQTMLAPDQKLLIGRMDLMLLVEEVTVAGLMDGQVNVHYSAALRIDGRSETLSFGPCSFRVGVSRDWQLETERYAAFLAASFK